MICRFRTRLPLIVYSALVNCGRGLLVWQRGLRAYGVVIDDARWRLSYDCIHPRS